MIRLDRDRETRRQRDMETEIERRGARDRETRRQTQNPLVGFSMDGNCSEHTDVELNI